MQNFLYNLGIKLYGFLILVASLWIKKAKLWVNGRKNWNQNLKNHSDKVQNSVWFHAASTGEFEQAKPIIEWIKMNYPNQKIFVTFFSPSGYEIFKNYSLADFISYLPLDTTQNAKEFLEIVQPQIAIFIKYEFWLNFLFEIKRKNIPCLLICGIFRDDSPFFNGFLKSLYQNALKSYTHVFVQDKNSYQKIIKYLNPLNVTISGDTRFDRVIKIRENWKPVYEIEQFLPKKPILMVGSSWLPDEIWIQKLMPLIPEWNFVMIPHEISDIHNQKLKELFKTALFYSDIKKNPNLKVDRILVIDKIGWLSRLYYYADAVWIGGGFGAGIHNTLEAAVYGKPILFGPNHKKFHEALGLIAVGAAFPVEKSTPPEKIVHFIKQNINFSIHASEKYVYENQGATKKITHWIKNNILKENYY